MLAQVCACLFLGGGVSPPTTITTAPLPFSFISHSKHKAIMFKIVVAAFNVMILMMD